MKGQIMHSWIGRSAGTSWLRHFLVLMLIGGGAWGAALGQEDDDDDEDNRRVLHDFSLSVSPSSGSVVQGTSRTYSVELDSIDSDGFDDEISLIVSGLKTGLTGTFSGTLSSTDTSTTLTVEASNNATLGVSHFTVTGTADNGLTRTAAGSVTVTVRQPTSLSITPSIVNLDECYTIRAGNAADMTLDLRYRKDGGAEQTITGWPTLDSNGEASACPDLASQIGSYVFTAYKNTQASTWITSSAPLQVLDRRSFRLEVSTSSRTVYRGDSGTYAVEITPENRFSSNVTLRASGLPSGVTASFSRNPVTSSNWTSTMTLRVGTGAATGRHTVTVTGTGGGLTRTDTVELVIPYFTLSMTPETGYVDRGSSRDYTVTVTPQEGFSRNVTLSVSDLGTGLSGTFSRNPVTSSNWTSVLTIDANCSASTVADSFTVTGTSGHHTDSDSDSVTPRSFSISNSPETADLQRGDSVEYTVTVTRQTGFSSSVSLSVSSLPSGVTGKFDPVSVPATSSESELTLMATSGATLGQDLFTVTGTAHGCTDTDTDYVDVKPAPAFDVLMTPETADLERGDSVEYEVEVDPDTGFSSNVTLSVSNLGTGLSGSFSRNPVTSSNWTSVLTIDSTCNASLGSASFMVRGTGGGGSDTDTDTVVVRGFDVEMTPETADLERNGTVQYEVEVDPDPGFSSDVALSVSGLPSGVTGEFSETSVNASTSPAWTSTLTLRATDMAMLGADSFTVTGTAHGCDETDTDTVVVIEDSTPEPGFGVLMSPETADLERGESVEYTVEVDPDTGFSSDVTLAVSNLPSGVTGEFSANPVNASTSPAWTSTLTVTATSSASLGSTDFTVTGTSGALTASDTDAVVVTAPPVCTITLDPQSVSVAPGSPGTTDVSVELTTVFGSATAFNLSVSGLATGVTGSFNPASVTTPNADSILTLTAGSNATAGTGGFTVTADSSLGSCTADGTVVVGSSFSLSVDPPSANVDPGQSQTYTVTVAAAGGFSSPVTLSDSGLGAGLTASFSPTFVTPTATDPSPTSTLTVEASATAAAGQTDFTITGTSGTLTQSVSATIVVNDPTACTLSVMPLTASVEPGNSQTYEVTLNPPAGTSSSFSLSDSGLGTGLTATFSPTSITPSMLDPNPTSTLTIDTLATAATGQHDFTVTATSGTLTCSASAAIVVSAPASFSLSVAAPVGTIGAGSSWTQVVTVNAAGGFTSPVTLGFSSPTTELTGSFSPRTVTPTEADPNPTATLTVTATTAIAEGLHSFTIGATGGDETVGYQGTVQIGPAADFALLMAPNNGSVEQGASRSYNVIVSAQGGFSSEISLSVSDLGTGLTGSFSPSTVTPTAEDQNPTTTLTIMATSSAATGSDPFTVTGTAGSLTRTATATVEVSAPSAQEGFTLSVDPTYRFILQGSSDTFSIDVSRTGGFTGIVGLSVVDLAVGLTATLSDDSLSGSETSSTLTISISEDFSGNATEYFQIQAYSSDLDSSRTIWILVIVQGVTFEVTVPNGRQIMRGESTTYELVASWRGFFNEDIDLSILGLDSEMGLTATFSEGSLSIREPSSTLTITGDRDAVAGTDDFVIVAKSENGTRIRSLFESVTVTGPDFSLEVLPWSKSVARAPPANPATGEDGNCSREENANPQKRVACTRTFMVNIHPKPLMNQRIESVTLTLSSLLPGLSGSFSDSIVMLPDAEKQTSTLTITATSTATLGYHQFTITGTGQYPPTGPDAVTLTRTTTARVEVYVGHDCRCADPWDGNQ